jgi:hypothetical protein
MSGIRDLVDRARALTRRETTGREDGWGVMVDPEDTDELRQINADPWSPCGP